MFTMVVSKDYTRSTNQTNIPHNNRNLIPMVYVFSYYLENIGLVDRQISDIP